VTKARHHRGDSRASTPIDHGVSRIFRLAVFYFLTSSATDGQAGNDLSPKPELTPQQVVEYQLSVLQHNDQPTPDAGIEKAFRFASPANQKSTGPISHFITMVHSAGYAPLLNAKEAAVTRVQMEDDQAKVLARVVSTGGSEMFYLFLLSKQSQGENTNCWMTDGVIGLQPADADQPKIEI
jgi:hypothetical protein